MAFQAIRFNDVNSEIDTKAFAKTLKSRVNNYFTEKNISKHANVGMVFKSIILLSLYLAPFIIMLALQPSFGINLLLWALMGVGLAGIGMSVMHDANHGAYSKNQTVNILMGATLNLLGGSVFNWKMQHNVMHHTYTNIHEYDDDIADKLVLKFNPHSRVKWFHKFQFIYAFAFYGILSLYWAVLKDFVQFAEYTKKGVNTNSTAQNVWIMSKIILSKIVYWLVIIFVPIYFLGFPIGQHIVGFLIMQFIAGLILTVIFQLAHTVEGTTHPLPNVDYTIENNWFVHQLETTINFSRKNKFISWYVGGLNFQVEHHLFPTICHVHYPKISEIVEQTCKEFNVPYLENKTFMQALRSHIRAVILFGKKPSLNDAIG